MDDEPFQPPTPVLPQMSDLAHRRRLSRIYHEAPSNRLAPAALEVCHGEASLTMQPHADYLQAAGGLHGMLVFKALDETSFYAANSLVDDVFLATSDMSLHLIAAAEPQATLFAHARVIAARRSSFVVDSWAWNEADDGRQLLVARATGTFVRTARPLPPSA